MVTVDGGVDAAVVIAAAVGVAGLAAGGNSMLANVACIAFSMASED